MDYFLLLRDPNVLIYKCKETLLQTAKFEPIDE